MSWFARLRVGNELKQCSTKCPAKSSLASEEIRKKVMLCSSRPAIHYHPPLTGRQCHGSSDQPGLHGTTLLLEELNREHKTVSGFGQKGWSWLSGVAYSFFSLLNIYRSAVSYLSNSNIPQPFPSSGESSRGPSILDMSSGSPATSFLGSQHQIPTAYVVLAALQSHA